MVTVGNKHEQTLHNRAFHTPEIFVFVRNQGDSLIAVNKIALSKITAVRNKMFHTQHNITQN